MIDPGKYALVTGASSGIGWHICRELAQRGYSIIAVSNQSDHLNSLRQELEETYQTTVHLFDYDLAKSDAAERIYDFCQHKNLSVEVLVNNAGVLVYGEVTSVGVADAKTILQLHMNTPAILCRLFGAEMAKNKRGYILNVSSISAVMAFPTISLYGPTKTFLRQFSRAAGMEMKDSGVTITCLLPGATATALYDAEKVNIPLALRLGVMKMPEYVARTGVKALFKKRPECVPGLLNKLIMIMIPLVPGWIVGLIYRKTKRKTW